MGAKAIVGLISMAAVLLYVGTSPASIAQAEKGGIYIVSPVEGETVQSPVVIKFGIKGTQLESSAQHNLLVNLEKPRNLEMPISTTVQQRLLSGEQAETSIGLAPGTHTLRISRGDISEGLETLSEPVTITVL